MMFISKQQTNAARVDILPGVFLRAQDWRPSKDFWVL